ncbi:MAG: hypothetical protein J6W85_07105 [Lachnospiraceae bacterium]|nr:hypothetical protein [Lachnospiraceae bacterium]MBP5762018.1 hypothetical protein [Lachnospiraceae bacterium]
MKMNAISHTRKAALAYLTIAAVLFSAVLTQINPLRVRAVDPVDVGSDDYVFNDLTDPPGYDYAAEAGVVYGTVDIPSENQQDHCMYNFSIVGVSAEIGTLNISPGGRVNIMDAGTDPGSLSVTTLAPSEGALMLLQSPANLPAGITLYTPDGSEVFTDNNWQWMQFVYTGGKWCDSFAPPTFPMIDIDSVMLENEAAGGSLHLYISENGSDYTEITDDSSELCSMYELYPDFNEEGLHAEFDVDPDTYGVLYFKVTTAYEDILLANVGDNPDDAVGIISNNGKEWTYTFDFGNPPAAFDIHIALGFPHQGDPAAVDAINNYIYAYSDLDSDSDVDSEDIRRGLAAEIYGRIFMDGIALEGDFEIGGMSIADGVQYIYDNTEVSTTPGSYSASYKNGSVYSGSSYDYSVTLGVDGQNQPVTATGTAYSIPGLNYVLVQSGGAFYVRDLDNDSTNSDSEDPSGEHSVCVIAGNVSNVRINGNGGGSNENIAEEGSPSFVTYLRRERFVQAYNGSSFSNKIAIADYAGGPGGQENKVRVLQAGESYVAVGQTGEPNLPNGLNMDNVACTGTGRTVSVYIGSTTVMIHPVNPDLVTVANGITSVELADSSMEEGVTIESDNNGGFNVTFLSNYYSSVPVRITYSDGNTETLTINRVGLLINYQYLDHTGNTVRLFHGNDESGVEVNYDYSTQQIIVWATYFHPTNDPTGTHTDLSLVLTYGDNSTRILTGNDKIYSSSAANGGGLATTDFIIGFYMGPGPVQADPFYATVVNEGYDDDTTFGGIQIGSGKGVYWDGYMAFYG